MVRYVAAYLLSALAGKHEPSAADIKAILESVGVSCEDDKVEKVISELHGKKLEQVIAEGHAKLASVPSGGAAVAAGPAAAAPAAAAAAPAKEEKKKEEKKKEESEEDADMGFGLFD
eukprot:comp11857_c0_seq1/m.6490 comp11857_c0_seq1/g.6490  ORF comp11857_c0_seq1/g.6490 comp11857_c0_seq1/m.6490 type:complete len:117 (-) comp11857_c0_seq1:641-991(-)